MIPAPNYTQIPNIFLDDIAKTLKEGELRVLFVIMRQTFGWHKAWDRISLSQLMNKTGMERKAVHNSLKTLIEKKLVIKRKEGKPGEENCWYTLIVQTPPKDEIIPDSESDLSPNSNNFDRYPKDTPPSILKIPTKETLSKEKNNNVEEANVVVFSKKSFEKEARKCGLEFDQIDRAWEKWERKAESGKKKVLNPMGWCIDCAKNNYRVPEEIDKENRRWIREFENTAEAFGKSHLIHANVKEGYIIFTDAPTIIYSIKERGFYEKIERQMEKRGMGTASWDD